MGRISELKLTGWPLACCWVTFGLSCGVDCVRDSDCGCCSSIESVLSLPTGEVSSCSSEHPEVKIRNRTIERHVREVMNLNMLNVF